MLRSHLLHLDLHLTVARVHVVELLLAALAQIQFLFGIQVFIQMDHLPYPAQVQPQVVPAAKAPAASFPLLQRLAADEHQRPEVEVVTDAACLVVYGGMLHHLAVLHRVAVAVEQLCIGIYRHAHHAFQCLIADGQRRRLHIEQRILSRCMLSHRRHGRRRKRSVAQQELAPFGLFLLGGKVLRHQQPDMMYYLALTQLHQRLFCYRLVGTRQKTIDSSFFSHTVSLFNISCKIRKKQRQGQTF